MRRFALTPLGRCVALRAMAPTLASRCLAPCVTARRFAGSGDDAAGLTVVAAEGRGQRRADELSGARYEAAEDAHEDDGLDDGDFDELEAASQEVHDICLALMEHLRRADPDPPRCLFERRVKRSFREPVPEPRRRLLHGHGSRANLRANNYATAADLAAGHQLFTELGDKLLLLLTRPVLDRLLESAGKGGRDARADGIHRFREPMRRAAWRSFPHRWFKHAPFEVQQLRADMPADAVAVTRYYRDHCTLRYLFTLMEAPHPLRARLEAQLFQLTSAYDPHARPALPSDSKSVTVSGKVIN